MNFEDGMQYTIQIYDFLHTPTGLFVLKIICPLIVGYTMHTLCYLVQRIRKRENQYLTELVGYLGNITFSVIMTYAFPNGYTIAQATVVGTIFGSCAVILHLFISQILWRNYILPRLNKKGG